MNRVIKRFYCIRYNHDWSNCTTKGIHTSFSVTVVIPDSQVSPWPRLSVPWLRWHLAVCGITAMNLNFASIHELNSGRWRLVAFRPKVSYANNCNMTINLYRSNERLNFNDIHKLGSIRNWPNGMVSWFLLILEKAILLWLLECVILVFWILYCTNSWVKLFYRLPITYELVVFIAVCHLF